MGLLKRYLERQQEEGWSSVGDKYVCAKCFSDYAISDFVESHPVKCSCDYCGKISDEPLAAEMDEVLSFIAGGINREYDIPENCLPWDGREGGWQIVQPTDGWDLVTDGGWVNEDSDGWEKLLEDLRGSFSDNAYVQRDPLDLSHSERLASSWGAFCHTVKHRTRFVLFKLRRTRKPKHTYYPDDMEGVPVYQILEQIGWLAQDLDLVRHLPRKKVLIRARQHEAGVLPTTAADLGAPPSHMASQSRMSPAGISMFYAADDERTAFLETYDPAASVKVEMSFATFETARKLRILDLTALPLVPSIFDESQYERRHDILFFHELARDISKPIARDGREHYEYVPTQIVAEHFRSVFRDRRRPIDGIAFRSSRKGAGKSYCLFTGPEGCDDRFRDKQAAKFPWNKKHRFVVLRNVVRKSVVSCISGSQS
ncbi:HEPN-associated N-terminal domain-containing protein [Actomonas aquatica]|uniref:HEPN-associated N-terminal domain-containing protein n=1 Tax=Actomonas aquatica TaxID=2866162 RepID=A0ABZ1C576_9BACT|nr:HEPN-associated N-terminal domain-containing protein [Opitutus sp. WL0086]WRQ86525.1 HEPN-associated N-terminal domain-containing protein [Opitutus sp. WL0086]